MPQVFVSSASADYSLGTWPKVPPMVPSWLIGEDGKYWEIFLKILETLRPWLWLGPGARPDREAEVEKEYKGIL